MDKQMANRRGSYKTKYRNNKGVFKFLIRLSVIFFAIMYVYAFVKATGIKNVSVKDVKNMETQELQELPEVPAKSTRAAKEQEYCTIRCETAAGVQEIPMEDFLVQALAASIDMQYEMETLKAQAVLLRGNCIKAVEEQQLEPELASGNTISQNSTKDTVNNKENSVENNTENNIENNIGNEQTVIDSDKLDFSYYSLEELKLIWGKKYEIYYKKAKEAVNQTKGIYAKSGDTILKGNFHAMSAGKTRSGKEVFGDNTFDYLQSVSCNKNLEGDNFLQTKYFEKSETTQLEILEKDSAGYVTKVSWNGKNYSGEQIREALGLASANFEIENGEHCSITTKGIGHGFGFDQYYANYMAQEMQQDYMDLISYFYKDISFAILSK